MSCKSVPQECPASDPQECPTRVSHKSVPQECPTRVSHKSFLQECPTRVQECPTRVSYNSVLQECPSRVSHKSVIWTYVVFRMCFHSGSWVPSCFSPHLCVGFCFLGAIPPDSASPPLPPSLIHSLTHLLTHSLTHSHSVSHSLTRSLTHSLTHSLSHSLTRSLTHSLTLPEPQAHSSLTHSLTLTQSVTHSLAHSLTHSLSHSLTHSLTLTHPHSLTHSLTQVPLAVFVAGAVPRASQNGLRRGLSPLVPLPAFRVAGAVSRASRRACGARCRRWCRWMSSWQARYPEPPEGPAARVVAAGAAACLRGRRSTQSLEKGLRRGLSPLVPLPACRAGAVPRASRRGCGAGCRRWCRCLPSW